MNGKRLYKNKWVIHAAGLVALLLIHFISDYHHFQQRKGFSKYSPYLFLLLLYGWIVFHNIILFDGLFLNGKKRAYFQWTALAIVVSSFNIYFIMHYGFNVRNPFSQIINFIIFTFLGLGLYVLFRFVGDIRKERTNNLNESGGHFTIVENNEEKQLPLEKILYLESLENYIKVHTAHKVHLVRLPLKEAERRLPGNFIRISRSCIINKGQLQSYNQETVQVKGAVLKIGKTYKRYVEEQFSK